LIRGEIMENFNIIYAFSITFIILWIFLLATTLYQVNRRVLEKKGYNEDFIEYIRKTNIKRNMGMAIVMPILGIFAALVIWAIFGNLSESNHLIYVYILWFLLIIPFPILEMKKGSRELKELAIKTNSNIVIDFKYKTLHLIFVPGLEAIFAVIYIVYFVIFIEVFHVAFIHILILWFLYCAARFSKNLTLPSFKETYIFNFIFMAFNHMILILHVLREAVTRFGCEDCRWGIGLILGISLGAALICKLAYYLVKLPEFKLRLKDRTAQ